MEGTPTAPAGEPPPPAPAEEKAPAAPRIAAAIGVIVLLFIALVAILVVADVADTKPCDEVTSVADLNSDGECYDRSSTVKTIVLIIGSIGALLTIVSAGLALAFAIRGRGGRQLVQAIGAAVFFLALTMIVG
jgi:hypothetical protein